MTFNVGHITGGTQSRCRVVKQAHTKWVCSCIKINPGWRGKCDSCGETRPT